MSANHFVSNTCHTGQSALVKTLLRYGDEPLVYIDDLKAHEIIMTHTPEFMDLLSDFYESWGQEKLQVDLPIKQVFETSGLKGDFRVMPCVIEQHEVIKSVKVIGTNEENRTVKDKICVGKTLLMDQYDNHAYALLDVCALSSFRTAAISALCFKLCYPEAKSIGLIGLGRIGFYTAYILHNWLDVKALVGADTNPATIDSFKKLLSLYTPDLRFKTLPNHDVIHCSDTLFLTTTSQQPILNQDNASDCSFISSVGADAGNLSELDETLLQQERTVLVDTVDSMLLGDMKKWEQKELIEKKDVLELKDLFRIRQKPKIPFMFISTGIALQDALINHFVAQKYMSENCD